MDRNSPEVCQHNCFTRFAPQFQDLNHDLTIPIQSSDLDRSSPSLSQPPSSHLGTKDRFCLDPSNFKYSKPGSTVIRGGFGLFSDLYPGFLADRFITNLPNVSSFQVSPSATNDNVPISPDQANNVFAQLAASAGVLQDQFSSGGTLASIEGSVTLGSFLTSTQLRKTSRIRNSWSGTCRLSKPSEPIPPLASTISVTTATTSSSRIPV